MDAAALLCIICPKRPVFSDVSHLLTHVSSKAHLSNYFKLQIRSQQEPGAGELLDDYDVWYKDNDLPKLLADRMASKEARKRKKSQGKNAVEHPANKRAKSQRATSKQVVDASPPRPLPIFLDSPCLPDPFLDVDNVVEAESPLSPDYMMPATPTRRGSYVFLPADYPFPSTPERPLQTPWKQECESEPEDEHGAFLRSIPIWDGRLRNRTGTSFPIWQRAASYDPFVQDDDTLVSLGSGGADGERTDEMLRLKGVLWPGMDIFDSATEQMRRKRNQRKDENVLRMMEKTSMCVEPTELIFSPTGILRKRRVISGNVEDGSPLPGESPIPRRVPRPKRVLSQADPNAQQGQYEKRYKKSTKSDSCKKPGDQLRRSTRIAKSTPAPLLMLRDDCCPSHEDDDDFGLMLTGMSPRPRGGISVFRDEPEPYIENLRDQGHKDAPRLGSPFCSNQDASSFDTFHTMNLKKRSARTSSNQETIEPLLDAHERIDPFSNWGSPTSRRHYATDVSCLPQYFLGDSPRAGFGLFDASLPKLDIEDDHLSPAKSNPGCHGKHMEPSVVREASDATISAAEEDEFERFCLNSYY